MTLPEMLAKVEDPRSLHGLRFQLKDLLLMCIIRNIVINIFRTNGHNSIKYATEMCNNNFKKIASLIKYKTMC